MPVSVPSSSLEDERTVERSVARPDQSTDAIER
jgi:hypothetical protein